MSAIPPQYYLTNILHVIGGDALVFTDHHVGSVPGNLRNDGEMRADSDLLTPPPPPARPERRHGR